MPTASVVVVNFEYERFLAAAIDSALAQTVPVEVVVVDDGSRDGSREVIARYGDRVRPVLKANGGHTSAINAGFAASSGDVVLFLDADDTLAPGTLAAALAEHEREPFAKVHWPLEVIDVEGRPTGEVDPPAPLDEGDLRERVFERGPGGYVTPPNSGNAYARSFLEHALPLPEDLQIAADGYLYEMATLYGRVARLDGIGGGYRHHGANAFGSKGYEERLARTVNVYELLIPRMAGRCRELGVEVDEERWRARAWPLRARRALDELREVIPSGAPFVLVDDGGRLGLDETPERRPLPFPAAPPEDAALRELERLRTCGARFVVVAWPGFPWFGRARRFARHLREAHRVALESERVVVFELS